MARKASVRYWDSRGGYCCWHDGSQVLLAKGQKDEPDGPTYSAALKRFGRLKSGAHGITVSEVMDKYHEWVSLHREPGTARIRRTRLDPVREKFGDECVSGLKPYDVQEWCDQEQQRRGWADGTARLTLESLKACLNWAAKGKLILPHDFNGIELPDDGTRGLECVLTAEQQTAVVAACRYQPERDLIEAMRDTGARPSEITAAQAKHYDPEIRAFVYEAKARKGEKRHKTRRSGKARVVYLRGPTFATVQRLLQQYPSGPLFRSVRRKWSGAFKGLKWGWEEGTILSLFRRLRKATGIATLIPYSFRHTFAVQALRRRVRIELLAEIMGTSIAMIQRHYGHLADQTDLLRRVVDEMDGPAAGG